jgi:uncharacterized protein (TIGR02001 family)
MLGHANPMLRVPLAATALLTLPAMAVAQESDPSTPLAPANVQPALDPSGEIVLLSDYRFRGISRSDGDPALQLAASLTHQSGAYAGLRATTLRRSSGLGHGELDLFGGWRGDVGGGFDLDAGLVYYSFADARRHADYAEPYASIGYLIGPAEMSIGAKYAPSQRAIGNEDQLYLFGALDVSLPLRPWSFTAQAGRQDWGRFGSYWNWSLGARYRLRLARAGDAELGIRYVDTDLPSANGQGSGLVLSAAFRF